MNGCIEWLPAAHLQDGYRRMFAIYEGDVLRNIVDVSPISEEFVETVKGFSKDDIPDPSLWLSLSAVVDLIVDGTILTEQTLPTDEDGYIRFSPKVPKKRHMIPPSIYHTALDEGRFEFSC